MRRRQYPNGVRSFLAKHYEPITPPHREILWVGPCIRPVEYNRYVLSLDLDPNKKNKHLRLETWVFEAPWGNPDDWLDSTMPQWRPWRGITVSKYQVRAFLDGVAKLTQAIRDGSIDGLTGVPIFNINRRHKGLYPTLIDRFMCEKSARKWVGIYRLRWDKNRNVYRGGYKWAMSRAQWLSHEPRLRAGLERLMEIEGSVDE